MKNSKVTQRRKIRLLRNHGLKNRDEAKIWGYNSRLDELQAAYALTKLEEIDDLNNRYNKHVFSRGTGRSVRRKSNILNRKLLIVFILSAVLGPLLNYLSPSWGVLIAGLISGSFGFFYFKIKNDR